jgi:hypothetical protein
VEVSYIVDHREPGDRRQIHLPVPTRNVGGHRLAGREPP